MLEPYQPKFIDVPRASLAVPLVGVTGTVPINGATPMMTSHHQQQARPSYPLIEYVNTGAVHQVVNFLLLLLLLYLLITFPPLPPPLFARLNQLFTPSQHRY